MKSYFAVLFIFLFSIFSCTSGKKKDKTPGEIAAEVVSAKSLGFAYLEENELDSAEAQFKLLIELAPKDASGYANLGVVYLRMGKNDIAEKNLRKAVELDPEDPDIRLNLAKAYELNNDHEAALEALIRNEEVAPDHVKTLYSIAEKYQGSNDVESMAKWERYMQKIVQYSPKNIVARLYLIEALLRNNQGDEALKNLEEAQQIFPEFSTGYIEYFNQAVGLLQQKKTKEALTPVLIFHNFLKLTPEYQGGIQELKGTQSSTIGVPVISFGTRSGAILQEGQSILDVMKFTDATVGAGLDFFSSGILDSGTVFNSSIAVADMDGDGDQDIYFSGNNGIKSMKFLLQSDFGKYKDILENSGIDHEGADLFSQFSDFDNDGYLDLFISNATSNVLYRNINEGVFENVTKSSKLHGYGKKTLFVDLDNEGDLDMITLLDGKNMGFINNGDGTFSDLASASGLLSQSEDSRDISFADFDNDGDVDIIIANQDGPCRLYSNQRQGRFVDYTKESGIDISRGIVDTEVADFNNDGNFDLLLTSTANGATLYDNNGDGTFSNSDDIATINRLIKGLEFRDAGVFDFDNDGFSDIIFVGKTFEDGKQGMVLLHNDGDGFSDASLLLPQENINANQVVLADYNQDGDLDIFLIEESGGIKLLRNDGGNANHHLKVQLVGLRTGSGKNNYYGIGSIVEMRAGELYQKKMITAPGLHFGLGPREKADVVRILWTNGTPQNIFSPGSDQDLIEKQELKGSCPFLYTWNGDKYVFVKDMMWRSALGMPLGIMGGKTAYAFADASEEYLKIPGELLHEKNGKYSMQITEELWETIYCDQIQLIAVDHPGESEIFVDEKFVPPPYPKLKVFTVKKYQIPMAARDGKGNDLLELIREKDDRYISNFQRNKFQGVTEMKDLILDLGEIENADDLYLFLNGWIFPTDASINVALSQSDILRVKSPSLEVINSNGEWQEVIDNIGFPSGKNKTVVVNLSGKFLSKSRKIRIRTNMEIYWDHIFYGKDEYSEIKMTKMRPETADYHYRGFSKSFRKGSRYGPHWFDYDQVTTGQKWRDLSGTYTRYGDVNELLQEADDKYVIANAGDETTITFDARKLPKLPAGWKRDFLIFSVGWVKDGDLNTAFGQTVEPLPYHGMSQYPHGKNEHYPTSDEHQQYQKKYSTREVNAQEFKAALRK